MATGTGVRISQLPNAGDSRDSDTVVVNRGGTTQRAALQQTLAASWAIQGNTDAIPLAKLANAPGQTQAQVNALISAAVEDWAEHGNATLIPASKLPTQNVPWVTPSGVDVRVRALVENFAEVGNAARLPASKLPLDADAPWLNQNEVDGRVRAGVYDWAETGNSDAIPADKLVNGPGLTQAQTDARVDVGVETWAHAGNMDEIPLEKLNLAPGARTFLDLTDTPNLQDYSAHRNHIVGVNAGGTALELRAAPSGGGGATTLDDLTDVDVSTQPPATGDVLSYNGSEWVPAQDMTGGGGGATTIQQLTDVDVTTRSATRAFIKWDNAQAEYVDAPLLAEDITGGRFDRTRLPSDLREVPVGGTANQVLTRVGQTYDWADAAGGGGTADATTVIKSRWAGAGDPRQARYSTPAAAFYTSRSAAQATGFPTGLSLATTGAQTGITDVRTGNQAFGLAWQDDGIDFTQFYGRTVFQNESQSTQVYFYIGQDVAGRPGSESAWERALSGVTSGLLIGLWTGHPSFGVGSVWVVREDTNQYLASDGSWSSSFTEFVTAGTFAADFSTLISRDGTDNVFEAIIFKNRLIIRVNGVDLGAVNMATPPDVSGGHYGLYMRRGDNGNADRRTLRSIHIQDLTLFNLLGQQQASGSGLSQAQVDARVRAGVADWAEAGDTSQIPANKLQNAPAGSAGTRAPDWVSTTTYNLGDLVRDPSGGGFFVSHQGGNTGNDPSESPTFWRQIDAVGGGGTPPPQQPSVELSWRSADSDASPGDGLWQVGQAVVGEITTVAPEVAAGNDEIELRVPAANTLTIFADAGGCLDVTSDWEDPVVVGNFRIYRRANRLPGNHCYYAQAA